MDKTYLPVHPQHICFQFHLALTVVVINEGVPLLLAEVATVPVVDQLSASALDEALHVGVLELLAPEYLVPKSRQHAVLVTLVAGLKVRPLCCRQLQPVPEAADAHPQFLHLLQSVNVLSLQLHKHRQSI